VIRIIGQSFLIFIFFSQSISWGSCESDVANWISTAVYVCMSYDSCGDPGVNIGDPNPRVVAEKDVVYVFCDLSCPRRGDRV